MQVGNHLSVVDRPQRRRTHGLMQLVLGLEQTGRIGEDVLRVVFGEQANDGQARGLRLGRDDREMLPDERVEQRRFADVRPTREHDGATPRHDAKCRPARRLARVSAALVRSDRELLRGPPGTEPVRLRTRAADRTRWVRAPADPFRAAASARAMAGGSSRRTRSACASSSPSPRRTTNWVAYYDWFTGVSSA